MEIEFLPIIPLHDRPNNNGGIGYFHHETPIFDQSKCYTILGEKTEQKMMEIIWNSSQRFRYIVFLASALAFN